MHSAEPLNAQPLNSQPVMIAPGTVLIPAGAQQPFGAPDRGLRPPWRVTIALALMTLGLVGLAAQAAYFVAASQPEVFAARSQVEYRGESWVETAAVTASASGRSNATPERADRPLARLDALIATG